MARYILDFVADTSEIDIQSYLDEYGCTTISILNQLGLTYLVEADAPPVDTNIVEYMIADEENPIQLLGLPSQITYKEFNLQSEDNWWKLAIIPGFDYDADKVEIVRAGYGQRVYLVDSGIDISHPEFVGKDITLLHSKTEDFTDTTGHGTALASLIVGETCGVTECSLKVVKVFHQGQTTHVSDILNALQSVAEDFSLNPDVPAVMNLSWAINKNEFVETKILALIDMGLIVSVAAGNSGVPIENVTPASMPDVVTVGSFGTTLAPSDFTNYTGPADLSYTAGSTNYGPALDLFAPGEQIRVALIGGGYGYSAGTSVAAAIASAVFAINESSTNASYAGYDMAARQWWIRNFSIVKQLLTLEGVYEHSPNAIPRARLARYFPETEPPRYTTPQRATRAKSGARIEEKLFDANYYTSASISDVDGDLDWTLVGNCIVGTAPEIETFSVRTFTLTISNDEMEDSTTYTIVVYNPNVYASDTEAYIDAGYVELACGCCSNCPCCANCTKGVCGGGECGGANGSCS